MDNDDVLDFSMKSCVKKMEKDQRSEVVSLSSGNGKTDNEQPLPRLATDALLNLSPIQIPFDSATPSFTATSIGSATSTMLVDPTSLMSTTSLALSTLYRRRRRQYSSDEKDFGVGSLNAKKSPNGTSTEKDDAYWERRRKNNQAAKRSRDARKMKEDEIAMRAAFLEQENCKLKAEVAVLKNEMVRLHCLLFNQMQP